MTDLAILIPVLGRPERAAPVLESALAATPDALVLFLASPGDEAEWEAIDAAGGHGIVVDWQVGPGDYARKINLGFAMLTGGDLALEQRYLSTIGGPADLEPGGYEWVFLGADDLSFQAGWYEACLRHHERAGACVIGTNDLGNSRTATGQHSTHTLVNRGYLACGTADEPGRILHEGYQHEFCDDELVHTAIWRGAYEHAPEAIVEHLHPDWGKGHEDETYRKARAGRSRDDVLFHKRQRLHWGALYGATTRGARR